MSTLVIAIPARQRLRSRTPGSAAAPGSTRSTEYAYATSRDGWVVESQGACAAALLPKAASTVAVIADADVSWHRITLPKAPAARLRAALVGVLEEALLEDTEAVHLAVAPGAVAGQPTWVAADRPRLAAGRAVAAREGRCLRRSRGAQLLARRPAQWPLRTRRRRRLRLARQRGAALVASGGGGRRAPARRAGAGADSPPGACRHTLERRSRRCAGGRAVAGHAGQCHVHRGTWPASRAQPLEPAPVRSGPAHPWLACPA